ncbi:MAG: carbamoyltransferase HypF [Pseudomonadota bacterium]|nr:carbamoyltransferase HypF [Pseudomonadota bacterium]
MQVRGETIRVRGVVQGVGFRPAVWRIAGQHNIRGAVRNDAEGVLIHAWGAPAALDALVEQLRREPPPLARIVEIERAPLEGRTPPADFRIEGSGAGKARTEIAPDAAVCPACMAEVLDTADRRYRYPFTNCTHCGPRLSIVRVIPYDRANTSMAGFAMCPACRREYDDPADRRFHAQPNACPECGPRAWLEDANGESVMPEGGIDAVDGARRLIEQGHIVAIKGIGGFHLACDAANEKTVDRLRRRKQRYRKAFALMARDMDMIRRYAKANDEEAELLAHRAAPIVVLPAAGERLAAGVAPGQESLGFMLPYTPLHHLLLCEMRKPIVLTSGNRSDEPQCIDNDDAHARLQGIADYWLLHDRDIVNRLDDSVLRFAGDRPRFLRRARGYAPAGIPLPPGFDRLPRILAMGGELKNTFCLLQGGRAVLSQHIGDLEDAATLADYRCALALYRQLFDFRPETVVVDLHPDYLSTQFGRQLALEEGCDCVEVQHHHAHIAACMAEHGLPLDGAPVLGIALDGLGLGDAGDLWGGEFLLADYARFERLASFQPVAMPGGAQAMREPWRNTYAHLRQSLGWASVQAGYGTLELVDFLTRKPLQTLEAMIERGFNSPPASSCGRLFDAVAAAVDVCRERASYEGQAAIELEALAAPRFTAEATRAYPFALQDRNGLTVIDWTPLWRALLDDLQEGVGAAVIAARFHQGLAVACGETAIALAAERGVHSVVLSGGVFQNRLLLEGVMERLRAAGLVVLSPEKTPANDGGLALGQALIVAAGAAKKPS